MWLRLQTRLKLLCAGSNFKKLSDSTMLSALARRSQRIAQRPVWRSYSTQSTPSTKPLIKLVSDLRKSTDAPITKVKEALAATNNDSVAALEWLQKDLAEAGAKKAAKLEGRTANEGLIGVSLLSRGLSRDTGLVRAAMVELNCETDFVARNELFGKLVADIAHSAAFHAEMRQDPEKPLSVLKTFSVDELLDAPLMQANPSPSSPTSPLSVGTTL